MSNTSVAFSTRRFDWGNNAIIPDLIYIDTNAIMDIISERVYGPLTEQFIRNLVCNNGMITWSQYTIDEITQILHHNEYTRLADSKGIIDTPKKRKSKLAEDSASETEATNVSQIVLTQIETIESTLENFGVKTSVNEDEARLLSTYLYRNCGSNLADAKHYAIANLSGTNNVLTQDSGFLRYPNINVYGASSEIVSQSSPTHSSNSYIDLYKSLIKK